MSDVQLGNRLLVIDDELPIGRIVQKIAERCDYEVVVTDDPNVFLKQARLWRPTVIVMDLKMPNVDGIQLLRGLASDKCDANVVISSGSDPRILEAAVRLGQERGLTMSGMMPKPIRAETLRDMLAGFAHTPKETLRADLTASVAGDSGELYVEYQPKLASSSRRITSVEALVRWRHPRLGLIRPDEFIVMAEETDLINSITFRVAEIATRQAASWSAENAGLDVAVNLSARNVEDNDLPERLCKICRAANITPEMIILELTETGAMRKSIQMMDVLTRLRLQGFRLSIDDFGTGYSSLVQLQRLPFSELKIDKSFVERMMQDTSCRAIVEIIISLAQKLGLNTVAEGVEDIDTQNALIDLGCDYIQGYYVSKPRLASDLREVLRVHNEPMLAAAQ